MSIFEDFEIQFFFATNKKLFARCPCRQELSHLHEFDEVSAHHVLCHMLGHFLDLKTGQPALNDSNEIISAIDQDGLDDELRYVYNDLQNPELNAARRVDRNVDPNDRLEFQNFEPEQQGCYGADARAELMAESIRACLLDPNYLKAVAPNVAARIRAAVNPNPEINRILQFN
ncbi:hypothetical protein CYK37_29160 [Mesorhizobium loti]|nr:hypothetical protein [Mesorhizobium loti]PLP55713.1 hypothetical protein CYK37_29160 [Mesorhizobium loti]